MKHLIFVFVVIALLTGCAVAPPAPTPAPTAAPPTPTSAPTAVPITSIDLEPLLIVSGDLPDGLSGAQVRDQAPGMFKEMPPAANVAYQQFSRDNKGAGGVAVFLYEQATDRDSGYKKILAGMSSAVAVADVGEEARMAILDDSIVALTGESSADFLFRRCAAVVHIRMTHNDIASNLNNEVIAYAKRLDKRLKEKTCQ